MNRSGNAVMDKGRIMGDIFFRILNMGLTAGWLIMAVVILRFLLKKAPRWIICLLWALVAFKLVCPFSIESAMSLVPSKEPLPDRVMTGRNFEINIGIDMVDAPVNAYLGDHYYEGVTVPDGSGNSVMNLAGVIWAAGVILMAAYSLISYYGLYRITRVCVRTEDNIYRCDLIDTPFILGIVKPRICLSSDMDEAQAAYVSAHERAHLKRRDHWWKPAGFLILSIYWFQPLCWLAYILFCRDIELACDEKVIRDLGGESKKAYAEALLFCSVKQNKVAVCPLAFGEVGVKERVKNILHYQKPAFWIILAAVFGGILAAAFFLTVPKEEGENTSLEEEPAADMEEMGEDADQDGAESGQTTADQGREAVLTELLARWRNAFCARDAETLADMMTPELADEMLEGSAGSYSFGLSSPWPWGADTDSFVYRYDEEGAEIYYYAHTSDPHITSWRETLQFAWDNDRCVITGENLVLYDEISTGEQFAEAYPLYIDGTMMDYTQNGLGEVLNTNALLSSNMAYRDLFEPESAVAFLLNLSKDPEEVRCTLLEPEQDGLAGMEITFLKDRQTVRISMLQPYGDPGIWVPVNDRADEVPEG